MSENRKTGWLGKRRGILSAAVNKHCDSAQITGIRAGICVNSPERGQDGNDRS